MPVRSLLATLLTFVVISTAAPQPTEKAVPDEASRKELQKFQGTWIIESQELDGKPAKTEEIKTRTFFCGADIFVVRKGADMLQLGIHKVDPSKSPRTINATISKGLYQGETMLGIYEIKDDRLKVCFDIEGQKRPSEFKTAAKQGRFLATYKRVPPPAEEKDDITGEYYSVATDAEGKTQESQAEVMRHGNAYLIKYMQDGDLAYVGVGMRKGDTFSVCWANRGEIGISVYRITKDGTLDGEYTRLGGIGAVDKEVLTRRKKK
jgi:uncharacterized protein (TIGR03067 family)